MERLSSDEITQRLDELSGWSHENDMLTKIYRMPSFPAAIAFITHVAFLAEAAAHHPDIDIRFNKVTLSLTTHDADGITTKDFDLAAAADNVMM